jgi:hypothetical protein
MLPAVSAEAILVAVLGSGAMAAVVAWFVDKRRQRHKRRVAIVDGAYELVSEGQGMGRSEILLDRRYLTIEPHLADDVQQKLRAQHEVAQRDPYGTGGNYYLGLIRREANRLAREWKLAA